MKKANKKVTSNKSVWKRLLKMLLKYRMQLLVIFLCLLCAAVLTFLQPILIQRIIDEGLISKSFKRLLILLLAYTVMSVFLSIVKLPEIFCYVKIRNSFSKELNYSILNKLERIQLSNLSDKSSTETVNVLTSDINNLVALTENITAFSISSFLQVISGILGMAYIDKKLTLCVIAMIPIKIVIVEMFSKKKSAIMERYIEKNRKYASWLGDMVSGIRELKLWDIYAIEKKDFSNILNQCNNQYKESALCDQYRSVLEEILNQIMLVLLYLFGGIALIKGNISLGKVLAFITYSSFVISPFSLLINVRYMIASIKPSAIRFFDFIDSSEEENLRNPYNTSDSADNGNKKYPLISFEDIKFSYNKQTEVLTKLDLQVMRGEHIGIIGDNGSGKSTLLDLLIGFLQPSAGTMRLDGVPYEQLNLRQIRSKIAYISQKPFLYQRSIMDNIDIRHNSSQSSIHKLCKMLGLEQLISRLKSGLCTNIGNEGEKLSGGERQKIAIARELLKGADIFLFDEATNNCDQETRVRLSNLINCQLKDKTVIIISHNNDVRELDKIYMLTNGKLKRMK